MCYNPGVKQRLEPAKRLQQVGLLTAIPFVLLTGPVIGYYLGALVDHRWSAAPWGIGIGLIMGLVSSARVTIQLIRQSQDLSNESHE